MKFKNVFLALLLFSGSLIFRLNAEVVPSNYGFDISIHPDATKAGVFQAKLVISELTSGKIVAAPTIRFKAGQTAEATSGETLNGLNFKFFVSVDEKASAAEYNAAVFESTTEISRSQAKISLSN